MKKITKKLLRQVVRDLTPFAEQLRAEGGSDANIGRAIRNHQDCKVRDFYNSTKYQIPHISDAFTWLGEREADSKIEKVFYDALLLCDIPFEFQVQIGPYRVDYLIGGLIVFEGDGPQHAHTVAADKTRDEYLRSMGYLVFRMRWELVAMVCDTVIAEIVAELERNKIIILENKRASAVRSGDLVL